MNVSLKTFMPVVAAGLLGLNACSHVEERAKDYMQDKAYSEFVELTNTSNTTLIQSRLDSLAYRDIFNGTKLANDSASVAEFNKIAACLRGYNNEYDCSQRIVAIEKGLKDQGILTLLPRVWCKLINFNTMLMIGLIENSLLKKEL